MKYARCIVALSILLIGGGMSLRPFFFGTPSGAGSVPIPAQQTGQLESRARGLTWTDSTGGLGMRTVYDKTTQIALLMGGFFMLYALGQMRQNG